MSPNLIVQMSDTEFVHMVTESLTEAVNHVLEDVSLGITGTREPTERQIHTLTVVIGAILRDRPRLRAIHHGCCIGIDEHAHKVALTIPATDIYGHPGYGRNQSQPYLMAIEPEEFTVLYPAKPYRERNIVIVTYSRVLLACPRYPEQDARSARSGTWQTVRLARQARVPVILIIPNGGIIHDHNERLSR